MKKLIGFWERGFLSFAIHSFVNEIKFDYFWQMMTKKHWDAILQWRITRMWRQMGWGRGSWWGRWRSVRVTAASLSARASPIPHSTKPVPSSWTKPHLSLILVLATISTTTLALLVSIMEFQTCMCSAQVSCMCNTQIAWCLVHFINMVF